VTRWPPLPLYSKCRSIFDNKGLIRPIFDSKEVNEKARPDGRAFAEIRVNAVSRILLWESGPKQGLMRAETHAEDGSADKGVGLHALHLSITAPG
jgi:hypothetical protein